jgi:FixJ family two-component response regulator
MSGRKEEVVEKLPEPFEQFAFVEKPFEQKQLADAIREAMAKAQKHGKPETAMEIVQPEVARDSAAMAAEIQNLYQKMVAMQEEITTLKKQMVQLVRFIKQKM